MNNSTISNQNGGSSEPQLGMAWYKFLIYFALIAGAILNFICGTVYITGGIYEVQTNGQLSTEYMYRYYGNALQVVDIIFGICIIGSGVLAIILRNKLAEFAPVAIKLAIVFYSLNFIMPLLYIIAVAIITSLPISESTGFLVFGSFLISICNIIYFQKRVHLFVPEGEPIQDFTQPVNFPLQENSNTYQTARINSENSYPYETLFCRKCGTQLLIDSVYCTKCGTKVETFKN